MRKNAYKILMLGSLAVGKTSIANRLAHDKFNENYKSTIGVQLYTVELTVRGEPVKLVIWDTDGDIGTQVFRSHYVLGSSGALIVCDMARARTFDTMLELSDTIEQQLPGCPHVCVFNKTDIAKPSPTNLEIAKQHNRLVAACSALNGEGVYEALITLVERIIDRESSEH